MPLSIRETHCMCKSQEVTHVNDLDFVSWLEALCIVWV